MKQKLINASIQLFEQKGYKETSVQDIVAMIGVTKGTFYYYFKSKDEVLKYICLTFIEDLLYNQEIIVSQNAKTNTEKLHAIVYLLIENIGLKRKSARIFFREMKNFSESNLKDIKDKRDLFRLQLQQIVEAGVENGEFNADITADIITFGILGITNWSYYWYTPQGCISEKRLTEIYVDFILNGIKGDNGSIQSRKIKA